MSNFYIGQVSEHAVIFNAHGEVLLLKHAGKGYPEFRGKAHLPGGRLEMDDQPGKALLREIAEETGIEDVELVVPCSASRWGAVVPVKYSVAYLAKVAGRPEAVLPEHEDHMGAEWVPWREAADKTFIFPEMNAVVREVCAWAVRLGVAA